MAHFMPIADAKLAYTIVEVARLTSTSRASLYRAIGRGQLKVVKLGNRTLILRTALEAFLDGLATKGSAP